MDSVSEDVPHHRFVLQIDETSAAFAYYRLDGDIVVLIHTEVPSDYAGQGIGTRLAAGTLDLIRRSGRKAVLQCPFMGRFFMTHPEYADVVAG